MAKQVVGRRYANQECGRYIYKIVNVLGSNDKL